MNEIAQPTDTLPPAAVSPVPPALPPPGRVSGQPPRRRRGCLWGLVALLVLVVVAGMLTGLVNAVRQRTAGASNEALGKDEYPKLKKKMQKKLEKIRGKE